MSSGAFGSGVYGSSPYGSMLGDFTVVSAEVVNENLVDVIFSDDVSNIDPNTINPANYAITPSVSVTSATIQTPTSVRLLVATPLTHILYTVVVSSVYSAEGSPINPAENSAEFTGPAAVGTEFKAVGLSSTRIHILFSDGPRLQNDALTDPASYTVVDLNGTTHTVSSVIVERDVTSVVLVLASPMVTTHFYVVTVGPGVVSLAGLSVVPSKVVFQWVQRPPHGIFKIKDFSGEVSGGILGDPDGLVFFSPALPVAAANSTIQVDAVTTCSRAYDIYEFPEALDPAPLYTYDPAQPVRHLNETVLWAAFPRLVEARTMLNYKPTDTVAAPVSSRALATFREPWAHSRVALLNNSAWKLFDNTSTAVPPVFITADNLTPIPPGPVVTVTLEA